MQQNPTKEFVSVKTLVKLGPAIQWKLSAASAALGLDIRTALTDGRILAPLAARWFAQQGGELVPDGQSGFLVFRDGLAHRIRAGGLNKISFSPSCTRGTKRYFTARQQEVEWETAQRFVAVFAAELPNPNTYIIQRDYIVLMRGRGVLQSDYSGSSAAVLAHIKETLDGRELF